MILVLTGPVHSGKTTFLRKLVLELKEQEVKLDGYLSIVVFKDGKLIGYDLFDVKKEKTLPFIRTEGATNWEKVGSYFFVPGALEEAKRKILFHANSDLLIIDELGPLEIQGGGLWPVLQAVLGKPLLRGLLVVRRNILEDFRNLMKGIPIKVFNIGDQDVLVSLREEIQKEEIAREKKTLKSCPS